MPDMQDNHLALLVFCRLYDVKQHSVRGAAASARGAVIQQAANLDIISNILRRDFVTGWKHSQAINLFQKAILPAIRILLRNNIRQA